MSATTIVARVSFAAILLCLSPSWARALPGLNAPASVGTAATINAAATTSESAAPPQASVVIQPRPTGYFVGDLVTQRILLEGRGQLYTPNSLPPPGRVNSWFERRRDTIVTDDASHHWLVIEYQFLNAPKAVTAATLPAWQLSVKTTDSSSPVTLNIPAASLNIAPLSPPGSPEQVGTRDLRPDHVPPDIDTIPIRHALSFCASGLALTLAAWLGWVLWRNQRAYATQPFAHALRELRTLPDDEPRAWQILHRAFDRTAGRVIQSATLPMLFERAPHLAPARAEIGEFFAQSTQRFFATARGATPAIHDRARAAPAPLALCQALRRIEKRHEQ
jgi:mxaA protein